MRCWKLQSVLATVARRLRYIKVYQSCWRIWRGKDDVIRLEELEDREIGDVERFCRTVWKPEPQ